VVFRRDYADMRTEKPRRESARRQCNFSRCLSPVSRCAHLTIWSRCQMEGKRLDLSHRQHSKRRPEKSQPLHRLLRNRNTTVGCMCRCVVRILVAWFACQLVEAAGGWRRGKHDTILSPPCNGCSWQKHVRGRDSFRRPMRLHGVTRGRGKLTHLERSRSIRSHGSV
jgi:hypothetical protein